MRIVLASTSPWRARLLESLGIVFDRERPEVPEEEVAGETVSVRAMRLAEAKARAVGGRLGDPGSLIIASDQVAHLGEQILHKPGTVERAIRQLEACSGQWVSFTTAICLLRDDAAQTDCEQFAVKFRQLGRAQIEQYVARDQPLGCAGSIKAEGLGVALIEDTDGRDVNTVYGLPLMLLVEMLQTMGLDILTIDN